MRWRLARMMAVGLIAQLGVGIVGAVPGFAQLTGANPMGTGIEGAAQRNLRGARQGGDKPVTAAPPVLPGTKSAVEPAAPTVSPATLSPTEALFDAINRGDATAARDAVNRGGNLDGHNLLGLTPLELSVDLGRNDISFMLLSMRGEELAPRRGGQKGAEQSAAEPPRATRRPRFAEAPAPERPSERSSSAAEPVVATPRLYSGGGGAPIPSAGFVGFDDRRSVR